MTSPIVRFLRDRDQAALAALLPDRVTFHSPVADYSGRADVGHLLTLIATVLEDLTPTRESERETTATTFFTARVADHELQGVLDEQRDADGRPDEITLMLRPFASLRAAIAAMASALEAAPLPSTRR